ncbi:MAG: GSCFA domain-containing protein [Pseudomonadota bacterium]
MTTPYSHKPSSSFWRRAVANPDPSTVDPVIESPFIIESSDRIATAGSCFAQHIARTLMREGYRYLVTEEGPSEQNYGVFPARFGNIYSTLQLLQLFQRAYGLFSPNDQVWRQDGAFVDPFRPQVSAFETEEDLEADRARHLSAVRQMFEKSDIFVFTLGLTETWMSKADDAVVPLAPGVAGTSTSSEYYFSNRSVTQMSADMSSFITKLRVVNPTIKVILTVSPVPLIATFEPRHVLVSTCYSKSALRVVAEEISTSFDDVAYFPSYEIITGHHNKYKYFAEDLREVRPEGVDHVMGLFKRHYLNQDKAKGPNPEAHSASQSSQPPTPQKITQKEMDELYHVICDEEIIDA